MIIVYVWPDYTWRYQEEFDTIIDMWKGDDYFEVEFSDDDTYEEIDAYIDRMAFNDAGYMDDL